MGLGPESDDQLYLCLTYASYKQHPGNLVHIFTSFWFPNTWGHAGFSVTGNVVSTRKMMRTWEHFRVLIFEASDTQPVHGNNYNSYYTNIIFIAVLTLTMMVADVHWAGILLYALYMKIPYQGYEAGAPRILLVDEEEEAKYCARGSFGITVLWFKVRRQGPQCFIIIALRGQLWGTSEARAESLQPDVPNLLHHDMTSSAKFMLRTVQSSCKSQASLCLITFEMNLWFCVGCIHRHH